jgi:hypothetical protein
MSKTGLPIHKWLFSAISALDGSIRILKIRHVFLRFESRVRLELAKNPSSMDGQYLYQQKMKASIIF